MRQFNWSQDQEQPIIKVPLLFTFPPVETLMKELTKLNSNHPYRIAYLGPRWADSLTFHKKYSANGQYLFDQRKNAKNTSFFSESMMNNQFYKNQIYYRAFQGMNPTLDRTQQLLFESRFQGGNLDCVVKVCENEYDLFLRIDSNTRGNIYWFYFMVKNCKKGKKVKFNICNLTKGDTHYKKGLNPFVSSSKNPQWTQEGPTKVTFKEKTLRYNFLYERMTLRNFYELSFDFQFNGQQEVRFAYCIPYLYSNLMEDLKIISKVAEVGTLGQSLTGVSIPLVTIGTTNQEVQKPVLFITGRIHPGESNSSIIVSKLMKFLCFSQEARFLRQKVVTVIVPMINPDGVILGNSRCGASGKDLNRIFRAKSKFLFPEVVNLKNLVDKISQTHDIQLYLDFHGHSRKKNVFMFGPDYNITQPQYYKCRVFPKILSNITNIFRYYSCSYDIPNDKRSTARSVMLSDLFVPIFFTVESSLGFYHDYTLRRDTVFTKKKWEQIGQSMVLALKEHFQGLEQYQQFLDSKRKAKKQIAEEIKIASLNSSPQTFIQQKKPLIREQSQPKREPKDVKDIQIFKLFQQIKELEEKRGKEDKKDKNNSSDQSDSHNSEQEFQKQKMKEFSSMVTDFVEQQVRKKENFITYEKKKNPETPSKIIYRRDKKERQKRRQLKMKEEQQMFSDNAVEENKFRVKRNQIKTQHKPRVAQKEFWSEPKKSETHESIQLQNLSQNHGEKELQVSSHQFLQDDMDFISIQKKANKMNFRMFNFSKMVQHAHSTRYHSENTRTSKPSQDNRQDPYSLQIQYPVSRPNYYNLSNIQEESESRGVPKKKEEKKKSVDQQKTPKTKLGFPSSFYRIKYHNNQRKKQQTNKQKQCYDFEESEQQTRVAGSKQNLSTHLVNNNRRIGERELVFEGEEERKMRLYAELRKFRRQ